jgi:hypothetical protein
MAINVVQVIPEKLIELLDVAESVETDNTLIGFDALSGRYVGRARPRDGIDGQNGKDGLNGRDGVDGRNGVDGQNGTNGRDGRDGANGWTPPQPTQLALATGTAAEHINAIWQVLAFNGLCALPPTPPEVVTPT